MQYSVFFTIAVYEEVAGSPYLSIIIEGHN